MNTYKNITWINNVRGICMLAVTIVHCEAYANWTIPYINKFLGTFYVNGFFFISGYLIFWKQIYSNKINIPLQQYISTDGKKFIDNIIYRLAIPSILFSFIEYIPSRLLRGMELSINDLLFKTIGGGTYWFVSALVIAEILLFIILLFRIKSIIFYGITMIFISAIGMLLFCNTGNTHINCWDYKQGIVCLQFLFFGGLFYQLENTLKKYYKQILPICILLILFITYISNFKCSPIISTLNLTPLGIITGISGIIIIIYISKKINIKPIEYIGKYSLGFYFLTGAAPVTITTIMRKIGISQSFLCFIITISFTLIISFIFIEISNKYFPFIWDFRLLKKHN